jgi:D-serine deaminase-like pyridoxal phosphate-dependent protein
VSREPAAAFGRYEYIISFPENQKIATFLEKKEVRMIIDELPTPALLLDLDILEANLKRMQDRANEFQVALRPHIKTHKCVELAKRQQALGAKGITVSTLYEAEVFAAAGFNDITWAFPLPPVHMPRAIELANKITFRLVLDNLDTYAMLAKLAFRSAQPLHVWVKVDCGYHRAGIDPASSVSEDLVRAVANSKMLRFDGLMTHAGHSYSAKSKEEIIEIAEQERSIPVDFAQWLRGNNIAVPAISIGSTPTATLAKKLDGVAEIRPGAYVFNDYTQVQLGVCSISNCALSVLASIVSHQPGALHFITDAGALALSKDLGPIHLSNDMGMGTLYEDYNRKRMYAHIDVHIQSISQEHGKIVVDKTLNIEGQFNIGERVRILEHHCCLTAANFDHYYVVRGEEVIDQWKILRGRI